MKGSCIFALLLAGSLLARAQGGTLTLTNIVHSAQDRAEKNLDTNVFVALQSLNQQKVHQFFQDMQQRFQGEYVVSLASFRDTAKALVPWLESQPETRPYGDWLKERLDYFGVADEIRFTIPSPEVENRRRPVPNLVLATLQKMWLKKVEGDSLPPEITNYLVRLKAVFIAQKVPPELFWLAEVESAFNASARSSGGGSGAVPTQAGYGPAFWSFPVAVRPAAGA